MILQKVVTTLVFNHLQNLRGFKTVVVVVDSLRFWPKIGSERIEKVFCNLTFFLLQLLQTSKKSSKNQYQPAFRFCNRCNNTHKVVTICYNLLQHFFRKFCNNIPSCYILLHFVTVYKSIPVYISAFCNNFRVVTA